MQWFVYLLFYMFCSFCVWCHFCCEFSNCGLCLFLFSHRFIQHPKNFGLIASFLERKVLIKIFWYFSIIQSYFQKYVARCHFFSHFRPWQSVCSSTTWPRRMKTIRTLCGGATGAVEEARYFYLTSLVKICFSAKSFAVVTIRIFFLFCLFMKPGIFLAEVIC